jgi:AcrR family transcriptional regulator
MKTRTIKKHQEIITAAKSLFGHTHDVKRVSLEAIATEAGVSPTTIYNNFGDRETLVFEVTKDLIRTTLERNRTIIHSSLPFPQKLIGIISRKMELAEQMDQEIIEKIITQDRKTGPYMDRIYEQEIKPLWKEIVTEGKREGYFDLTIDDEALIAFLDIIREGLKARPDIFQNYQDNMNLIKQLTRLMFYGFLKKDIELFEKETKQP